jgi:hypothetical protein
MHFLILGSVWDDYIVDFEYACNKSMLLINFMFEIIPSLHLGSPKVLL